MYNLEVNPFLGVRAEAHRESWETLADYIAPTERGERPRRFPSRESCWAAMPLLLLRCRSEDPLSSRASNTSSALIFTCIFFLVPGITGEERGRSAPRACMLRHPATWCFHRCVLVSITIILNARVKGSSYSRVARSRGLRKLSFDASGDDFYFILCFFLILCFYFLQTRPVFFPRTPLPGLGGFTLLDDYGSSGRVCIPWEGLEPDGLAEFIIQYFNYVGQRDVFKIDGIGLPTEAFSRAIMS